MAFSTQLTLHNYFMLCANQHSDKMDTIQCLICVVVCKAITGNWHTYTNIHTIWAMACTNVDGLSKLKEMCNTSYTSLYTIEK